MTATDVASRVRQLLETNALPHRELAKAVELDPDKLSKSLSGVRRFTSLELASIADHFGVSVNWLLGIDETPVAVAARQSGSHVRLEPIVEQLGDYAEVRSSLIELGYPNHLPTLEPGFSSVWFEQGSTMAEQALDLIDKAEASVAPGNLIDTIEEVFNVDVVLADLQDGCDGLAWRRDGVGIIAAATTSVMARQRFTLAHELCHVLNGDHQDLHVDQDVYKARQEPSEVRANAFAASLLMPERRLRLDDRASHLTEESFASLVMDYAVSPNTLSWRLYNLDMIDQATRGSLGQFTAAHCAFLTGRSGELASWVTASTKGRPPVRLLRESLEAYLQGRTTLRLFSRVSGVPTDEVREAIEGATAGLEQSGE